MSDIAREMLRMFGLGMGLAVPSNQRLTKARELRDRESDYREIDRADRVDRVVDDEPTVPLRPKLRVITGSAPWIPPNARIKK